MNKKSLIEYLSVNYEIVGKSFECMSKETGYTEGSVQVIANKHGFHRDTIFEKENNEVFKDIVGYEEYKISNYGKIINRNGKRLVSSPHHQSGYLQIRLGKNKTCEVVHILVARTFLGEASLENPIVDHIDRNRTNNYVENLRWTDYKTNRLNSKEIETFLQITEIQAKDICEKISSGMSISKIVKTNERYTKSIVEKIRQRIRWITISKDYKW